MDLFDEFKPIEVDEKYLTVLQSYVVDELKSYLNPSELVLFTEVDQVQSCELTIDEISVAYFEETVDGPIGHVQMDAQVLVDHQYGMNITLRFESIDLLESQTDPLYEMIKQTINQNLFDSVVNCVQQIDGFMKQEPRVLH